ncbi:Trk system potassium transporter TrkA [Aliifodinibius sp. S!AR15-10]|uniref:Trk system potassium transporter TrkA n=1 Tax=Aliifodinibius sp. S!AR15-10 TaxID=2950437 RepID=UPI0028582EE1|nr:Trk system potassium transporter TrkA [Aliifodinibius sp. S!AR15-10]MDR8391140.1 Trk system potassium transporter TrkA [Aliifodinibius sp. S!AR15-10]
MKIVIIGAGEIGYDLASVLSKEKHDVIVLDRDKDSLNKVTENLDVLCHEGNATSAKDLVDAGVKEADITIAVTSIDEVNMIASMLSKRLGTQMVIARIRNDELSRPNSPLKPTDLGIDVMIHPELSAAQEIVQLIKRSTATDVINLADDKMQLIGLRLEKNSPLVGKTLSEYAEEFSEITFRVVAIARRGLTIIPSGTVRLQALDQIFVLAQTESIPNVIKTTGKIETEINTIMIAGGTPVGEMVARMLCSQEKSWTIKLIEPDYDIAVELAQDLKDVLVLNGNPTDPDLLATEGISDTDAFISVTDDEESNIISCLMAKHLEVKKTVALVSKSDYIPLSQTIGLDAAINKKSAASNEIHRYVRRGRVISVTALQGIKAEVIELQAAPGSKVVKKPIQKIGFPQGCVIGGIQRNGSVEIATGQSQIKANDRVIVFCLPEAVDKITSLFQ